MGAGGRTGWKKSSEFRRKDRPGALTSPRWPSKEGSRCGRAKGRLEAKASSRWEMRMGIWSVDPQPDKSGYGERRRNVSTICMPRSGCACRPEGIERNLPKIGVYKSAPTIPCGKDQRTVRAQPEARKGGRRTTRAGRVEEEVATRSADRYAGRRQSGKKRGLVRVGATSPWG
jgi:hypothetical protein